MEMRALFIIHMTQHKKKNSTNQIKKCVRMSINHWRTGGISICSYLMKCIVENWKRLWTFTWIACKMIIFWSNWTSFWKYDRVIYYENVENYEAVKMNSHYILKLISLDHMNNLNMFSNLRKLVFSTLLLLGLLQPTDRVRVWLN